MTHSNIFNYKTQKNATQLLSYDPALLYLNTLIIIYQKRQEIFLSNPL
jgi:hypothetical protein